MTKSYSPPYLNAICAYFTMFPFSFPAGVIERYPIPGAAVLDPFCGRGTTNLAGRAAGRTTIGIDSNPVAIAIAQAKLVGIDPQSIVDCAYHILDSAEEPQHVPQGEFWNHAYAQRVLYQLSILREELLRDCQSDTRIALRAIILGALHGPANKGIPSYFSNQSLRTFAPKPAYAVRFWTKQEFASPKRRRAGHHFTTCYSVLWAIDSCHPRPYHPWRQ